MVKQWKCAGSKIGEPKLDAETTADNNWLVPAAMAAHRGSFYHNRPFKR
jgi:hypothetical protein